MPLRRIAIFIGASLLLHLILLATLPHFLDWLPKPKPKPSDTVRVTLLQRPAEPLPPHEPLPEKPPPTPPEQMRFVDTTDLAPADQARPDTPFESDQTTRAASARPAQGDPNLPSQEGIDLPGLTLRETPQSPESKSEPAPPTQETKQKAEKTETADKPQPKPAEKKEVAEAKPKPAEQLPLRPLADVQVRPHVDDPGDQEKKEEENKKAEPVRDPFQAAPPPPSTFMAQRRRSAVAGGAAQGADSSVEARESELGKYKARLYRGIGSRWYVSVQNDTGLISIGTVRIRFYIRHDGTISDVQIVQGRNEGKLTAVSRLAILEMNGQLPFPEAVRKQVGDGFYEEVTFTVY